ncbi:Jumonji AT rich interactive domain 2 [Carabus blaptoides fortunei]
MGPIMAITVPTLHVGMVFSACCWYRDPHGLPWIKYLHTGANKIWANLYVSLVIDSHEEGVYCLDHAIDHIKCKQDQLKYCKLLYTYDIQDLDNIIMMVYNDCIFIIHPVFKCDCMKSDKNVDDVISNTNNISSNNSQLNKNPESKSTLSGKLKIISRVGWLAQPPTGKATPLKHPVPYVIILHTATENCSAQAACTLHVSGRRWFGIRGSGMVWCRCQCERIQYQKYRHFLYWYI